MFQDALQKLDLSDVATIVDRLNPQFDGVQFDPVDTIIMATDVSFYPGYTYMDVINNASVPPVHRYVLSSKDEDIILDFTNEPIYKLNKELPIRLTAENVSEYVRFFFTYVRGRHGRFLISETVDDIQWKEEPPPAAKKTIGKMLKPLELKETGLDGQYEMVATMMFKDSLFKCDVKVSPAGLVTLENEELVIEDMPVLDDVFGQ